MNLLARLALLAYPRSFRRDYGAEWLRTVDDMRVHGQRGAVRIALTITSEALTTALSMRWEYLMKPSRTALSVAAATVALAALLVGSPAIAILLVAVVALVGLQFAGRHRPVAPTDPSITGRWYLWLAAAAGAFLIGLAVLAIDGDGELTTASWAAWMLSWAAAAVLGVIGLGLAAVRLVAARH